MQNAGSGPRRRTSLLGRGRESAVLDELLAAVRRGEGSALVLRGEPGIGKTALLEYLAETASDVRLVRAVGVKEETELAYSGLHQLCRPLLDRLPRLPAPQREALEVVFGYSAESVPERLLVGVAVLSLFSEVAQESPLLCVIDDAQWLDQASALTLAFVARRIAAERVGIVFAGRDMRAELGRLPELRVEGLGNDDARVLLGSTLRFILDPRVRDQIVPETQGNPLALLELPRGLTLTQLAGGFGLLQARTLSREIEESFVERLTSLSEDARRLLVLAAAEPLGDPLLLWPAAEKLGITPTPLMAAETDDLLSVGSRVTFQHPFVRSAVYAAATPQERRVAHIAIAEVTDRDADADRRAWHLAAAAAGPNEEVALELERSAGQARARAGLAAAAAFLERAVELSGDPARRTERALAAVETSLNAGAFDVALPLLGLVEEVPLDEPQRAHLQVLQGIVAYAQRRGSDAPQLLLSAAKALTTVDSKRSRQTYLDAWGAALFAGPNATAGDVYDVSREARDGRTTTADATCPPDMLLDGFTLLMTEDHHAATPVLQRATLGFAAEEAAPEDRLRWGWLATIGAIVVWDYETCLAIARQAVELARESGALTALAVALDIFAQAVTMRGDFGTATHLISELGAVTDATGMEVAPYSALHLSAYRGHEHEVFRLIDATIRQAVDGGQGLYVQYMHFARSLVFNGLARHREALRPAEAASDETPELAVAGWALCELIEAAAKSDEPELGQRALERLAAHNQAVTSDWACGVEARARALLANGTLAEDCYREAIERLSRTQLRPDLARAHLVYGEWLRRENRRLDARAELRTAYDQLSSIGMEAFAERARAELLATGERVATRMVEGPDELTAQEREIAELARDGLSNQDIGTQLFLSPRTVEWHLRKIFSRLDIRSRHELANALTRRDAEAGAESPQR